jgi:spore coat polysaccharide biosynthesis protein SpsF (cytidylyltransferase family)
MSRTVAFIQARMSSSRLPGKVLEPLAGVPMIVFMARRAQRARTLDEVVVVTSNDPRDDALADTVAQAALPVFRGSLDDVLDRFAAAAQRLDADEVVRLTGDCPLIDAATIDAVVEARRRHGADYASNVEPPTYPDGLDVEAFSRAALERAQREARLPSQREHVTLWMREQAAALRRVNVRGIADCSHLRLTVDYADDLEVVRRVVAQLPHALDADLFDILRVVARQPDILSHNPHARNEGLIKSLALDPSAPGARP